MGLHLAVILFALGVGMAFLYTSALWWTVRRLPASTRPVLLVVASFWVRMPMLAACLYLVMDGYWERLAASFSGFFITRTLLVRRVRDQAGPAKKSAPVPPSG